MVGMNQPSFAGGEVSTEIQARVDIGKYSSGLKTCLNFLVKAEGGAINRPGYEFIIPTRISPSDDNSRTRLIPFSYNTEQTYDLVFGHEYMWVLKDGGVVLDSAVTDSVTGVTIATDKVLATGHPFTNGMWVFISGLIGASQLNNRFFRVRNVATNDLQLEDQNGNAIDFAGFDAWVSGGTISKVYEMATPYDADDLPKMRFTQSANVMTLSHPSYDPRELTRVDHDDWTLTTSDFEPDIGIPTGVGSSATINTNNGVLRAYTYVVTAEVDATGEVSYASAETSVNNRLLTSATDNYNTITWSAVAGADRYNVYKGKNGIFGWIGQTPDLTLIDDNISADVTDTPPVQNLPFSGSGNKPRAVSYHQQRRVFGGSNLKPNELWGTQLSRYNNMALSRPSQPTDAYNFGLVAKEVQEVRDLLSMRDLLAFTSGGVWSIKGTGGSIEPGSIDAVQETEDGTSEFCPPVVVGRQVLYVHNLGKTIADFSFDFSGDGYDGDDLTLLAKHLFKHNAVIASTWHKEPYKIVWYLRDDGILLALTYHKKHQIYAWSRIETNGLIHSISTIREGSENVLYVIVDRTIGGETFRYIERMHTRLFRNVDDCFFVDSGRKQNNWNDNAASTVTLTGGTAISVDDPNWPAGDGLTLTENGTLSPFVAGDVGREIVLRVLDRDGVFIERCRFEIIARTSSTVVTVVPAQAVPVSMQATALSGYGFASDTVDNLWHLEGQAVIALADGDVEGEDDLMIVENGQVTLQTPAVQVHIGLRYNCDLETLRLNVVTREGSFLTAEKTVAYVDVMVEETRHIQVAQSLEPHVDTGEIDFSTYFQRGESDEEIGAPTSLLDNKIVRVTMPEGWNQGQMAIRQDLPLPISILALSPEVVLGN